LAALAVAVAGCGGSSGGSVAGGQSVAPPQSPQALKPAALKEGKVVWYTTFSSDDVQPFIDAFHKDYPQIKVDALRLSADKLPARILTEQRGHKYNADIMSGDETQTSQLILDGALAPYDPPELPQLPSGLDLPKGYRSVVYVVTTVIAYNPSALKAHHMAPPKSWQDLTKPEWKGHFSIDPGAVNWYASLIGSMGHDKALALVQALGRNKPRLVESHTQALTEVQAGEPWATATAYGYKAAKDKRKTPDQLDFVNSNPLPASLTLIDMVKNAPHPSAAKLFLDWMESADGQKAVVDITNHTSLRGDVGNDPAVWNESTWKPAWTRSITQGQYNTWLSEYTKALGAP
jgi:iron(III) transport system substrate-binding protein